MQTYLHIHVGMEDDVAANSIVVAKFWFDLIEPHNMSLHAAGRNRI